MPLFNSENISFTSLIKMFIWSLFTLNWSIQWRVVSWFRFISPRITRTSCISLSVAVPNSYFMPKPIPFTTPRLLLCVFHHDMSVVIDTSAVCSHDRAIAVDVLCISCFTMYIMSCISCRRSAGNSGFVIVMMVVNSPYITTVSSSTSISMTSGSLVAPWL